MHLPTARDHAAAVSITALMSPHRVTGEDGMDLLKRAVEAIDINSPLIADYQTWINLLRAIKAACGGDEAFFTETVLPWLEGNADNTEKGVEWLEERWKSFSDSQLGAAYVFGVAAAFGFTEGDNRAFDAFADRPIESAVAPAAQSDTGGDGSTVGGAVSPPGGPLAANYTDKAVSDIAAGRLSAEHRYSEDRGWVKLESGVWVQNPTILRPISDLCAEIGQPYRSQGKEAAQIDLVLNSARKH